MKTSINYLPEQKREDLRRIVKCVLEVLPDCEMIILYGSYARNTYVDYDQRIEYGVRTCFMSDYDILVVTATRFQNFAINNILNKAIDNYYKGKNPYESTTIQFINESIDDLNKAILKNRYFYTDIKREGIMLYDSGRHKLARRRKLNFQKIKELAEEYYDDKYGRGDSFLKQANYAYMDHDFRMASFDLHQACENYYKSLILTFTLYSPKEHSLISCQPKLKHIPWTHPKLFLVIRKRKSGFLICCRMRTFRLATTNSSASPKKILKRLFPKWNSFGISPGKAVRRESGPMPQSQRKNNIASSYHDFINKLCNYHRHPTPFRAIC